MNLIGSTFIALADDGRLFGLDYQLLLDAAITAFNVFILFVLLSYILFNPVRNMLKKRQDKITSDRESAKADKQQAQTLKAEYEEKLKQADKEAEAILSEARKVANTEAELEKQKVADEVKQQIIAVASVMAAKLVAKSIDDKENDALIEETLNEMGEKTWLS